VPTEFFSNTGFISVTILGGFIVRLITPFSKLGILKHFEASLIDTRYKVVFRRFNRRAWYSSIQT